MADVGVISSSSSSSVGGEINVELLMEGDAVTSESSRLSEEAILAPDPDVEMKDEVVKDEQSTSAESETATSAILANNLEDENKVSTSAEKLMKGEIEPNATKTVVLLGDDGAEDDIIVLDDEDESGVSGSKRPRKDEDDDIMEVDELGLGLITKEGEVGKIIRKMKRQDLEDLVLAKIVEGIVSHTEVGQLRAKVLELQMQKDKMANKMGTMMKQVAELSTAVNVIMDNEMRDPKNRIGKPHAIRFSRSVGLQTSIEPSVRTAPPKIIRVPEPAQNGVRQYGGNAGKGGTTGQPNGNFNMPHPQPVKRAYQGNKAGADSKATGNQSPASSPKKVYSSSATPQTPTRLLPIVPKTTASSLPPPPPPVVSSRNVPPAPGIVDLTDDDPPTTATSTVLNIPASVANSAIGGTSTTVINGVQYQIFNRSTTSSSAPVQIVPAGQKYIVTSSGQPRPVLLQQQPLGSQQQLANNQSIVLRGVNNNTPVTIVQQRQVTPRPMMMGGGNAPRVVATIPVRNATGTVLGPNSGLQRRFVLPPLPATPAPKVRNDALRQPPKPDLTLNEQADGIVLSWNLPAVINMAEVTTYQIFACQENLANSAKPLAWKRVGDVKALPLPMACTLSQFTEENRYYFIVRGIDVYGRVGPFCDPQSILLRLRK